MRLYELGRVYLPDAEGGLKARPPALEGLRAAGVLHGLREGRAWSARTRRSTSTTRRARSRRCSRCSACTARRSSRRSGRPYHPRASAVVKLGGVEVGTLGELHPRLAKKLDLPAETFLFELDLGPLYARRRSWCPRSTPLTRFPAVLRDLAVVVPDRAAERAGAGGDPRGRRPARRGRAGVRRRTRASPSPRGRRTSRSPCSYRSPDRTLTDEEVSEAHQKIVRRGEPAPRGEPACPKSPVKSWG